MRSNHPLDLGPHSTKLRGVWVRSKRTGYVGYIAHVERVRGDPPKLWVVYPPGRLANGTRIKTWSAGSGTTGDFLKLKRKRHKFRPRG